ncbi:ExeM/NucH family extracellular endonuclease [Kribbia dieselivorans]|uniref:ExeM/NucH family extracellular endonuclease n=1 Tax=Kribbia dieselivorans TaxID=331526 RepID=UPI000838EE51|nr:ExeM/NucH family extracellular endonuclease [Kribbia dieselivorans]
MSVWSQKARPLAAGGAIGALALAGGLAATLPASAAPVTHLVISEAYGGGGNSGATLKSDFVELYNPTSAPISLAGLRLEYLAASNTNEFQTGSTVCTLPTSGAAATIGARQHHLVRLAGGTGGTDEGAPTPDGSCGGAINMSGSSGRIQLVQGTGASAALVDRIGWGSAVRYEGASAAPGTANATSVQRKPDVENLYQDTDQNGNDVIVAAPTPKNSGDTGGGNPVEPGPQTTPIAEIQGPGNASPLVGRKVTTTGVVTANYPDGGFNGFYLQTPGSGGATDTTPGASDGIFVYGRTNVTIGSCYEVAGTVTEYNGLTELTNTTITPKADCAPVAPVELDATPTDAQKEALEGMLVLPQGTHTITNNYQLNQYGQLGLVKGNQPLYQATDVVAPGAEATAYEAANEAKLITLDDGSSWNYMSNTTAKNTAMPYLSQATPMRTGSQVTFTKPVILDYRFQWNYQPTGQVVGATGATNPITNVNDRPATAPAVGGDVKVASFNVLNYFTDLGKDEANCRYYADRFGAPVATNNCSQVRGAYTESAFADQQAKIVTAINGLGADVVSLEEIETSSQITYRNHDRDATLAHLVTELNKAGGSWAYVSSPVAVPAGEDVIRTAFIYNFERVQLLGESQILADGAFANARYPLAQKFKLKKAGSPFVVIANHFKSKGSGFDDGTGQGLSNPSRVAQATALTGWVNELYADEAVLLMGDFNAYSKEDPIRVIQEAGYTNLAKTYDPESTSYQFSGRLGSLDHAFANEKAMRLVSGAGIWNINADESIAMQYSRRNYNVTDFHTDSAFASSDHDPIVVGLNAKGAK